MDANIRNNLINGGLKLAFDLTGLIPGLAEAHGALQIASDLAPILEAEIEWFQSKEGQAAMAHVSKLFTALSGAIPHAAFAPPAVQEVKHPGMCWAWAGGLDGYQWMSREDAARNGYQIFEPGA